MNAPAIAARGDVYAALQKHVADCPGCRPLESAWCDVAEVLHGAFADLSRLMGKGEQS